MKTHPNITQKSKVWFTNELKPWLNSLNTYSFDKLEYLNNTSKVVVTCKRHGDIETTIKAFRENHKCRKCSNEENFLAKMSDKYKEYDFKETIFTNSRSEVTVKCLIHESSFTVNANGSNFKAPPFKGFSVLSGPNQSSSSSRSSEMVG